MTTTICTEATIKNDLRREAVAKIKNPELSLPQQRILKVLADLSPELNLDGKSLADEAKIAHTWITGFTYKACAANRGPALCELGLVKAKDVDVDGRLERRYSITAAGRRIVAKMSK